MDIKKLFKHLEKPPLFERGNSSMWEDPYISKQLLQAHLDPNSDAASRRPEIIDKTIFIEDKNAFQTTKDLARIEGIFAGMSSGASMYVALQIAKKMSSGNIIVILPDRGEKYLSTNLFN